jgi:hypothetical protein
MNEAGFSSLEDMIARLRGLPKAIEAEASRIAQAAKSEIDSALAEGHGAGGEAWIPRKDGSRPLVHAAQAVASKAVGTVLLFTLTGPEVWHHFGTRHTPKRPILPIKSLPASMGAAIKRGLVEVFQKRVGK